MAKPSGNQNKSKNSSSSKSGGGGKNTSGSSKKKKNKHWAARFIAVIIIAVILGASMFFESNINAYLRLKGYIEEDYSGLSATEAVEGSVVNIGGKLNVHFVDVGQGDACIIELPDDRKMIIDGGKDKDKAKLLSYIEENIYDGSSTFKFDFAILTHSDEDHCGGLDDVFKTYSVGVFYRPNQLATYNNYSDPGRTQLKGSIDANAKSTLAYMRAIDEGYKAADKEIVTDARDAGQNRIIPAGISETSGEFYEINFYTPTKDSYKDVNDYSPIIILTYQNKRIALSGDAEAEAEKEFVDLAVAGGERFKIFDNDFCVDLIKLGHHGSYTSSSENYLNTLTTAANIQNVIIIISCGAGNSYGHPHEKTLERLKAMGFSESNILRTDINGNIAMSIRQDEGGAYQMFYGAEMVRSNYSSPVAWREIAIIIFVTAVLIILVQPIVGSKGKRKVRGKSF